MSSSSTEYFTTPHINLPRNTNHPILSLSPQEPKPVINRGTCPPTNYYPLSITSKMWELCDLFHSMYNFISQGRFKQTQCDSCVSNGGVCGFIPPFIGPLLLKLPKNCSNYQSAHQVCKRSPSDHQCGQCSTRKLKFMLLLSSQGTCPDIKALW